jgi:NitT/TauT family transport system permease protein
VITAASLRIGVARVGVLVVVLALWEYLPAMLKSSEIVLFNPIFISTPSKIAADLYQITFVSGLIFPALWSTLSAAIVGLALGMLWGYVLALLFSEIKTLDSVLMIYINALNAVPRITIYPLIVIIFGFGFGSKIVGAFLVSFFLVFYNAYQGSKSIPSEMTNSYSFLGARRWHLVRYIRAYVALGWAFALLPSAVAFALISVITTEILISTAGLGALIIVATAYLDTSRVFSIIFVSMITSVVLVGAARLAIRRLFPWIAAIQ